MFSRLLTIEFPTPRSQKPQKSRQKPSVPIGFVSLEESGSDHEQKPESDSEDESEGEESGEAEDFYDVLDILDGKADMDDETAPPTGTPKVKQGHPLADTIQETGAPAIDDNESDSGSDESPDENAAERLGQFITELTPSNKRKAAEDDESKSDNVPRKRIAIRDQTEAGLEGEYLARRGRYLVQLHLKLSLKAFEGTAKLNIDDLLQPLASSTSERLIKLKKDATSLTSRSRSGPLHVPLPHRTQDRLARDAAYQQTKEEVEKWQPTMKRIREVSLCPLLRNMGSKDLLRRTILVFLCKGPRLRGPLMQRWQQNLR